MSNTPANLAANEKKAARKISLDGFRGLLIVALVLWIISLVLPVTSGARGIEVLLFTPAGGTDATIAEFVHTLVVALGVGLFNVLLLITRRTLFSWLAWLLSGIGLFYSVFALWMRQTQDTDNVSGVGMYLSVGAVILAVVALSSVILRRDPEQARIAEERASSDNLDEVGEAQRAARGSSPDTRQEDNALLIDDRRARAAERHRRRPGTEG